MVLKRKKTNILMIKTCFFSIVNKKNTLNIFMINIKYKKGNRHPNTKKTYQRGPKV